MASSINMVKNYGLDDQGMFVDSQPKQRISQSLSIHAASGVQSNVHRRFLISDVGCVLNVVCFLWVGRDNSVGIATVYGLDGPGIESR
jgi:hypothetical protein